MSIRTQRTAMMVNRRRTDKSSFWQSSFLVTATDDSALEEDSRVGAVDDDVEVTIPLRALSSDDSSNVSASFAVASDRDDDPEYSVYDSQRSGDGSSNAVDDTEGISGDSRPRIKSMSFRRKASKKALARFRSTARRASNGDKNRSRSRLSEHDQVGPERRRLNRIRGISETHNNAPHLLPHTSARSGNDDNNGDVPAANTRRSSNAFSAIDSVSVSSVRSDELSTSTSRSSNRSKKRRFRRRTRHLDSSSRRFLKRNGVTAHRLRQTMITAFFYIAIAFPITTLVVLRTEEVRSMESTFDSLALQIQDSVRSNFNQLFSTMNSLSVATTSQAAYTPPPIWYNPDDDDDDGSSSPWPYVTVWDFERVGIAAMRSSNALFIGYHPKIHHPRSDQWALYSTTQYQNWMPPQYYNSSDELPFPPASWTIDSQGNFTLDTPRVKAVNETTGEVIEDDPASSYFFTTWQTVPVLPSLVNLNLETLTSNQTFLTLQQGAPTAVLDGIVNYDPDADNSVNRSGSYLFHTSLLQNRYGDQNPTIEYTGQPSSILFYPVFDNLSVTATDARFNIVGVYTALIYWELYFQNVLPDRDQNSVVVVVEEANTDVKFSVQVDGRRTTFLGYDDYHDRGYEYLSQTYSLLDLLNVGERQSLSDKFNYTISVFPTDSMQNSVITLVPYYAAGSVLLFFSILVATSLLYDVIVQDRLKRVLEKSQADQQIVNQIFPKQFRKRLLTKKRNPAFANVQGSERSSKNAATSGRLVSGLQGRRRKVERRNSLNSVTSAKKRKKKQMNLDEGSDHRSITGSLHPKDKLKSYLHDVPRSEDSEKATSDSSVHGQMLQQGIREILSVQPIADYFPACTVLFADVTGFSAWSSEREPEHVFILLEALFQTMDRIAHRRRVFKVETVGDSYMAVTGLPDPQPDHAVRMARFSRDCMTRVHQETKQLESSLGPDTGELRLRIGMHSGPVTAGVLRGAKTRFQLFGDTVNTAARMESTSLSNRIQISASTATLLKAGGKSAWMKPRTDIVHAKGKGDLQTFWLALQQRSSTDGGQRRATSKGDVASGNMSVSADSVTTKDSTDHTISSGEIEARTLASSKDAKTESIVNTAKNARLVDWLSDIMMTYLKKIEAQRRDYMIARQTQEVPSLHQQLQLLEPLGRPDQCLKMNDMVLDEVFEAFTSMPAVRNIVPNRTDPETIRLADAVIDQVRDYVRAISMLYHPNSFHNFDHCSHVTQSATKLLKRIVNPKSVPGAENAGDLEKQKALHLQTYGITADALAQFAVVFCSLIHDVDHRGVPNGQLSKEEPALALRYKHQSVAEQNSVDIAWDMLMQPEFTALQRCIFSNRVELRRFRQYVVNLVMATDIFNPCMKSLRNQRWDRVFPSSNGGGGDGDNDSDTKHSSGSKSIATGTNGGTVSSHPDSDDSKNVPRKATIVLEHIIQAADVSHTMQHWNVYKKWNERLFREMYYAYKAGRAQKDPSEGWYKGELWFFDNYIIPLARKLEECGVFGVSSDECLIYALENRKEWAAKGEGVVKEMVDSLQVSESRQNRVTTVAGRTMKDLEAMSPDEFVKSMKDLIRKGRYLGTFKSEGKREGQVRAAKSWMDALHLYEAYPGRRSLPDASLVFPVYSGTLVFLNAGLLRQDDAGSFEWNLVTRYVKEAKREGTTVHIARALAAQCDAMARRGDFKSALNTFQSLTVIYDPKEHSAAICKVYGTDRVAQMYSQRALWLNALGEVDRSLSACHRVLKDVLPHMDSKNVLNTFELLYPLLPILRRHGAASQVRDVFVRNVVDNFAKHGLTTSLCRPLFVPVLLLMDLSSSDGPEREERTRDAMEWLMTRLGESRNAAVGDGGVRDSKSVVACGSLQVDPFLDCMFSRRGWSPNSIMAELCLYVVRYLLSTRPLSDAARDSGTSATATIRMDRYSSDSDRGQDTAGGASNGIDVDVDVDGTSNATGSADKVEGHKRMIPVLLREALRLCRLVEREHKQHAPLSESTVPASRQVRCDNGRKPSKRNRTAMNISIAYMFHRPIMREIYSLARSELGEAVFEEDDGPSSPCPSTQHAMETSMGVVRLAREASSGH